MKQISVTVRSVLRSSAAARSSRRVEQVLVRCLAERLAELATEVGGRAVGGAREAGNVERLAIARVDDVLRAEEMPGAGLHDHGSEYSRSGVCGSPAPTLGVMQDVIVVPNEVAAELAGIGDGVLDSLRDRLGCTVSLRGNRLTLDGDDGKVAEARAVVEELVELVEGGHAIGPDTVDAVAAALDQSEPTSARSSTTSSGAPRQADRAEDGDPEALRRRDPLEHRHVRDRPRRNRQDVPRDRARRGGAAARSRSAASSSPVPPSRQASGSASFPATCSRRSIPYMRPLFDALYDTMDPEKLNAYMERGTIEVAPLAFMRGRTLNDWFIILDEAQNTSPEQMQMFLTRLGFGSKMVVTGDVTQVDLPREQASGLIQVRDILARRRRHRRRRVRARGRRPAQARAADRRGVQAARRTDRHRAQR